MRSKYAALLLLLFLLLLSGTLSLNTYTTTTVNDDFEMEIWQSTSDFIPREASSYGSITVGKEMAIEFDLVFKGRTNIPREGFEENFFRIGHESDEGGCDEGSRYPSLWLRSGEGITGSFDVSISDETLCDNSHYLSDYGNIPLGLTMHLRIAIYNTFVQVDISGGGRDAYKETWSRPSSSRSHVGVSVPVWFMSDKASGTAYNIGDVVLSNIVITSRVFNPDALYNYPQNASDIYSTVYNSVTSGTSSPNKAPYVRSTYAQINATTEQTEASVSSDNDSADANEQVLVKSDDGATHHNMISSGDMITVIVVLSLVLCACIVLLGKKVKNIVYPQYNHYQIDELSDRSDEDDDCSDDDVMDDMVRQTCDTHRGDGAKDKTKYGKFENLEIEDLDQEFPEFIHTATRPHHGSTDNMLTAGRDTIVHMNFGLIARRDERNGSSGSETSLSSSQDT